MNSFTIVGYTYKADVYCAPCVVSAVYADKKFDVEIAAHSWNAQLIEMAQLLGIDSEDESSYDNDNFPKVIFADQLEGDEMCCSCNEELTA